MAGVATLAGVARHIPEATSAHAALLVLHVAGDTNVAAASADVVLARHAGASKRLRVLASNATRAEPWRAARHNFEEPEGACAAAVWPELLSWAERWAGPP